MLLFVEYILIKILNISYDIIEMYEMQKGCYW